MISASRHKGTVEAIFGDAYTPLDVREFVELCTTLALPLVRKKIRLGKLNFTSLGLSETDVVYDCLADLFRRGPTGSFIQIKSYFELHCVDPKSDTAETVLITLRQLVFTKIHTGLIRLYSETDPVLGKILRNLTIAIEKSRLFDRIERFGECYLVARDADPLLHLPPIPQDELLSRFSRTALVHDTVPTMVRKLHELLVLQESYQRLVPLMLAALLFRGICTLGWEAEEAGVYPGEEAVRNAEIAAMAGNVCRHLSERSRATYVEKRKRSEETLQVYILTVQDILLNEFSGSGGDGCSYFDRLKVRLPGLTKREYAQNHRKILEYLARQAKEAMRREIRNA